MENEQEKTKEAEIIEAKPKRNYQKKGEQK
jgi:hypothetical protein